MRASVGKKRPSKACSKCEFDRAGLGSPIVSVGVPHHAPLPLLAKFESHPQFSRQSTSLYKAEPILYLGRKDSVLLPIQKLFGHCSYAWSFVFLPILTLDTALVPLLVRLTFPSLVIPVDSLYCCPQLPSAACPLIFKPVSHITKGHPPIFAILSNQLHLNCSFFPQEQSSVYGLAVIL